MNGWGSVFLAVAPDGAALPCHAAKSLPGLIFPNVTEHSLSGIWYRSEAFNRYRGDTWMKEPCRSCSEKEKNFGGCRCQAYALTGEAENADPVCSKSADHRKVQIVLSQAQADDPKSIQERPMFFRTNINSHRLASKT